MAREWAIHAYKARLDSAIDGERWDEADRIRVAAKRRLLEMVGKGESGEEIAAARDGLASSFDRLRLSKRVRIDKGPLAVATRLSADAETAGIAAEQAPLPQDTARDVKERILQILSSGNRRPWSTGELAGETARRVETVARAVSQLRAERKIVSRRIGRHVLHRLAEPQRENLVKVIGANANAPFLKSWGFSSLSDSVLSICSYHVGDAPAGWARDVSMKIAGCTLKLDAPEGAEATVYQSLHSLLENSDSEPHFSRERMALLDTKMPILSGN